MKSLLIERLVLLVLVGVFSGCAPTGGGASERQVARGLQGTSESPTSTGSPAEYVEANASSRGEQSTSRTALRPGLDGPAVARAASDAAEAPKPQDPDWTMSFQPNGSVVIMHQGVPVAHNEYVTWVEQAKWVGTRFEAKTLSSGGTILTGAIPALDLEAKGEIRRLADNELGYEYRFRANKSHHGIKGAVLVWKFDLNSPTFEGKVADPVLLENQTGWMWQVGANQSIVVRFERPLDKIIFERNNKNDVRTFLIADELEPGTRQVNFTVQLPEGGRIVPSSADRYGSSDMTGWFSDAWSWDGSPVDLSFLNAGQRPAGRHGLIKADGDQLVFEDGTSVRFWGCNVSASALFATPRENVVRQAHRLSQLGFNLVRLMHVDAPWSPNIFDKSQKNTRRIDPKAIDNVDWSIRCLKAEGIYVWLELNYGRSLTENDGVTVGFDEIKRSRAGMAGFSYFNQDLRRLMQEFQHQFLDHVNRYTRLAYKDDPAVVGVLITNENDLTTHYGNVMLPDKNNPAHNALFNKEYKEFARKTGLPQDRVWRTWEPGPSKLFLNDMEHRFNEFMIEDLRRLGVRAPLATTDAWGNPSQFNLPSLTDGDIIDVHSYGDAESLSANPRYEQNFISWIALRRFRINRCP